MKRWPGTLSGQLSLIFLLGLLLAYALSFAAQFYERYQSSSSMINSIIEREVGVSVAVLDRLPAAERGAWLERLQGRSYRLQLGEGSPGQALDPAGIPAAAAIAQALGTRYPLSFSRVPGPVLHFEVHLRLTDGAPVTLDVQPLDLPLALWLPTALAVQLLLLLLCTGLAVRLAIRPLARLARAAEQLDPNQPGAPLAEQGPREVAHAAAAFNAMQRRIAESLKERMHMLGAIAHDLQTPITRMKLRAEFMEPSPEKDKLWHDLGEIEQLVREGLAYARGSHEASEPARRIHLDAFVQSLVFDYQDLDKPVSLQGTSAVVLDTRPHALRRILVNLLDNALKFAGAAELHVRADARGVVIEILDRGPGIAAEHLGEVLKPFYRLENSRNRESGGSGLGLAIAQQLAQALGAQLLLAPREGGGLAVQLRFSSFQNA
ncbi:HAMP domain-containing sensor histidine kinase [Pseudomonas sp. HR96]|uniref:sensor histidine kinase n=1 Tax=Pseudomonas sp. HR96 TaxID=1027966 RepID=UPI002A7668AF|nr:HAMP domain-containing sensor histidine kinase [Pseudomonas sp. HR96]WPO98286.1 HAMP domain-containing sensor histidine kinase [Pseudomonas sp. HR96]